MNTFTITRNEFLRRDIKGFYYEDYLGYGIPGNPNYINVLKNTFGDTNTDRLVEAANTIYTILKNDLDKFSRKLAICIVPRAKAEKNYNRNQLIFKNVVKQTIGKLGFIDGSDYILRHTDTKTTHLAYSSKAEKYAGDGKLPYPGITMDTCHLSKEIKDKHILLIDDIYTKGVNVDEDAIQALLDSGAKSVIFYAVAKTRRI